MFNKNFILTIVVIFSRPGRLPNCKLLLGGEHDHQQSRLLVLRNILDGGLLTNMLFRELALLP
jgi:hypothetical protein